MPRCPTNQNQIVYLTWAETKIVPRERIVAELLAHQRSETVGTFAEVTGFVVTMIFTPAEAAIMQSCGCPHGPQHIVQPYRVDPGRRANHRTANLDGEPQWPHHRCAVDRG
jgi:hypothetical protein